MAKDLKSSTSPETDLISTGYECPDYSQPEPADGAERETHTCYPSFRVCKEAAVELHKALTAGKLLGGEFAAIVVLKNTEVRVSDNDEDEDSSQDYELSFTVKAILPSVDEGGAGETEADIMAEFDKLPKAVKDKGVEETDEEDND